MQISFLMACGFVFLFQNCSKISPDLKFSAESSSGKTGDDGVPYDGKIYVLIGAQCPDGTQVQSKIILGSPTSAALIRQRCQDIPPVKLASGEFQFDLANPTVLSYQNQFFTAQDPLAVAGKTVSIPSLNNPLSPLAFGAKCDGVTDDSAAFQSAVTSGDVLVPAGKTCVINRRVDITVSNRHIECGAGSVLKQTQVPTSEATQNIFFLYSPSGNRLTGDSIVNCTFVGTNTAIPQYTTADSNKQYNIPVRAADRVDNFLLAGNTFERFWGQSMFQTFAPVDAGSGDQIIYNVFKSCGQYGPALVAHINGLIAHNTMVDCAAGVVNDNTTEISGGNVIEFNTLTAVYGQGYAGVKASVFLTGGAAGGANYSTNIVRNNIVSGFSLPEGANGALASQLLMLSSDPNSAQYSNNVCTNGCVEN